MLTRLQKTQNSNVVAGTSSGVIFSDGSRASWNEMADLSDLAHDESVHLAVVAREEGRY